MFTLQRTGTTSLERIVEFETTTYKFKRGAT
jgi:hypothetical protein